MVFLPSRLRRASGPNVRGSRTNSIDRCPVPAFFLTPFQCRIYRSQACPAWRRRATRQLPVLYNKTGSFALGVPIALIALETLVLGVIAISVSLRLSLRRS